MNLVYTDNSQNLLHLIYVGTLDRASAIQLLDAVKTASARLRHGFDILADLRDLKVVDKDAVRVIAELMELLDERGARKIVGILPNDTENFGFGIMSIFHYGNDVRFVTCFNLEAALASLSLTRESVGG